MSSSFWIGAYLPTVRSMFIYLIECREADVCQILCELVKCIFALLLQEYVRQLSEIKSGGSAKTKSWYCRRFNI